MLPRKFFDKNGAIWCILSVPKLVIIKLKINIFFYKSTAQILCQIFLQDQSRRALDTQKNTFTLREGREGGISPQKLKKYKNGGFTFFIPGAKIYPVMMWIQIHARGSRIFY